MNVSLAQTHQRSREGADKTEHSKLHMHFSFLKTDDPTILVGLLNKWTVVLVEGRWTREVIMKASRNHSLD